jgi:hypothetical protein
MISTCLIYDIEVICAYPVRAECAFDCIGVAVDYNLISIADLTWAHYPFHDTSSWCNDYIQDNTISEV